MIRATDCFVIRWIIKRFYLGVQDKMAAISKLSPHCYGVTVILLARFTVSASQTKVWDKEAIPDRSEEAIGLKKPSA